MTALNTNQIGSSEWIATQRGALYTSGTDFKKVHFPFKIIIIFFSKVDIIIGGFSSYHGTNDFVLSSSYFSDDLTWCIQKSGLKYGYLQVMSSFTAGGWCLIVFSGYLFGFILFVMLKFSYNEKSLSIHHTTYLIMLPMYLNMPPLFKYKSISMLLFTVPFCLFSLNIFCRVFSEVHMLVSRRFYQNYNFVELQDNNYKFGTTFDYLIENIFAQKMNIEVEFYRKLDECVNELIYNDRFAIAISREYISNKYNDSLEYIFCFNRENRIESMLVGLLVRRDYELLKTVNRDIKFFAQAGLISHWMDKSRRTVRTSTATSNDHFLFVHGTALYLFLTFPGWLLGVSTLCMEYLHEKKKFIFKSQKVYEYTSLFFHGNVDFNRMQENRYK